MSPLPRSLVENETVASTCILRMDIGTRRHYRGRYRGGVKSGTIIFAESLSLRRRMLRRV